MGIFKKRLFLGHASAGKPIRPPDIAVSVSSWTTCKRDLYVGHPNWSLFPSILSIILSSYSRPVTSTISISILFRQKQYRYFPYHSINTEHTLRYLICHYVCYQRFCFSFKCVATVYFEWGSWALCQAGYELSPSIWICIESLQTIWVPPYKFHPRVNVFIFGHSLSELWR